MGAQVVPLPSDDANGAEQEQQAIRIPSTLKPRASQPATAETLALLHHAQVAGPSDRDVLSGTVKASIHSIKVLGEGAFGIVDLVLIDSTEPPLLCVRKKLLKQTDKNNNNPELEVEFLDAFASCPFVVHIWSSVIGLYDYTLLLEYCPYGALDKLLLVVSEMRSQPSGCLSGFKDKLLGSERYQGFTEEEARFYVACCVLGLEAMHAQGVLHRDLKPSNLLLAENGYAKLGDLGLCKQLGSSGTAHSQVGTPGYMAPEVLNCQSQKGTSGSYSFPADMWSLGIMTWELVDGLPPRWAPLSWYYTSTLHFPDRFSKELRSLLTGLLQKSPSARLHCSQVKQHPWFAGIDWQALSELKLTAPRYPELESAHIHSQLSRHTHAAPGAHHPHPL